MVNREEERPEKEQRDAFTAYWCKEEAALEVEIQMPSTRRQIKQASRDFTAYLVGEIRKGRGEVRERSLNPQELKQFEGAKQKEVNQYIEQEVLETLPPEYVVPNDIII